MGSKMKQDKAVTSPQPTPARSADWKEQGSDMAEAHADITSELGPAVVPV